MSINPAIFKAYDIRGVYPEDINEDVAYKIGQAYARLVNPKIVALGRDVRISSPSLFEAIKNGLLDHGVKVVDIGIGSTDTMYFAVANYGYDGGLMITASHNPREYNGVKMVRAKGVPVSGDSGIMEIRDLVAQGYAYQAPQKGESTVKDASDDYVKKILSVVDVVKVKSRTFKIVANINFGPTAERLRKIAEFLPLEIIWLNEEPNGEFPKGRPDPLVPENRQELVELVRKNQADFGVAWDCDADRIFFVDETGRFLSGYFTTAVLAKVLLEKYPGGKIITDMKLNWAIIDTVKKAGGIPLSNKTGHSFFKARMIAEDAIFGGEVSGHYCFKDFFYLDNGLIPLVLMLELLAKTGQKMSQIYQPYFENYFAIEETNFTVTDKDGLLAALKDKYSDGKLSEIDGVAIEYPDWRFSVRASNTEPVVRLNLEARSEKLMEEKMGEVIKFIKLSSF
ncbi:MAG: phosphomannomutase/phosphoglucomutase [bacterium]|nr:phosphomannomutase/phosphoglucomutase [bacterium]